MLYHGGFSYIPMVSLMNFKLRLANALDIIELLPQIVIKLFISLALGIIEFGLRALHNCTNQ